MTSILSKLKKNPKLNQVIKMLAQISVLRALYSDLLGMWKNKSLSLDKVHLPNSVHTIYVDPTDKRGRALFRSGACGQKEMRKFLHYCLDHIKPDIILDIGVNYGEFIFSGNYEKNTRLIGVEANYNLRPFLERSRLEHSNANQIEIVYALASDKENDNQLIYIDTSWSGNTSASCPIYRMNRCIQRNVPTITIDKLLNNTYVKTKKVIFKIDVEGFEYNVLLGMSNLIKECVHLVGYIEFSSKHLCDAEIDINSYLKFLSSHFMVFVIIDDYLVHINTPLTLNKLSSILRTKNIHTDLIITSDFNLIKSLSFI